MIDETLANYLYTLTGKNAYAGEKPVGNNDCIVFNRISNLRTRDTLGRKVDDRPRFQINVYNADLVSARTIANLIKDSLDGNATDFFLATCENDFDFKDIELNLWRSTLDFYITHN